MCTDHGVFFLFFKPRWGDRKETINTFIFSIFLINYLQTSIMVHIFVRSSTYGHSCCAFPSHMNLHS